MRQAYRLLVLAIFACTALISAACPATERSASTGRVATPASPFHAGEIIETANGQALTVDELASRLLTLEVIYLGEEHHNRFHIEAAVSVLNRLFQAGRRPVVAMEMFGWESQRLLDRYVEDNDLTRQDFLDQLGWGQNWGGPFETYEPLVAFPKMKRLRLVALNPPKSLVRLVAKKGLEQARREEEWGRWNMQEESIVDDAAYRQKILEQLRACHGGGTDDMYRTMYEASMVRDEGMARTIVKILESLRGLADPAAGPVVSYTGGGHIQYNLPVPKRVTRRLPGVRQASIYMTSYDEARREDLHEMLADKVADYLWLTQVSPEGMPRRCR